MSDQRKFAHADLDGASFDRPGLDGPGRIAERAAAIARAGSLDQALTDKTLPSPVRLTLAEALVLGLLKQGVKKYLAIFGHGSTQIGEVLRVYDEAGLTRTFQFRNEVAMAHAATALSWAYGEIPALVTSIGPGALQAMAGSLAAASNGVGVYHLYGDETTHGEGYNMQQVPKPLQGAFGMITGLMNRSYTLHTPEALREALRQGIATVHHPAKPGPFTLMLPINTQPQLVTVSLDALPSPAALPPLAPADDQPFIDALTLIHGAARIVIKAGGGARRFADQVRGLAERIGAVVALAPGSTGVLPDAHVQNMHVGGSKGSISGNYAMAEAELLIAIGSRAVCQSDCSGIGYPKVRDVINFNLDVDDVRHYNRTLALQGDIGAVLDRLNDFIDRQGFEIDAAKQAWLADCAGKKAEWRAFKQQRYDAAPLFDEVWKKHVLTQPQAIKLTSDFAKSVGALKLFDAGDVQANGFQIVEDDNPFDTITESGASYMGFAASALMAGALADQPRYAIAFSGDGSFLMNPQILVDAVAHGLRATIVIFDNRRMAAISALQIAQYGRDFRTNDNVAVDYVQLAGAVSGVLALSGGDTSESIRAALEQARSYDGLSVIHVPVYAGPDALGDMGAHGQWNVGNWVEDVQTTYRDTSI
jgi:3D-(3,5/4)-trihydroxycyclohexane-1,2-dione acylhydrolase (decyclizing)